MWQEASELRKKRGHVGATRQADRPGLLLGSFEGLDSGVSVPMGQGRAGWGPGSRGNR